MVVVRERKLFLLVFSSSIGSNTPLYTLCKITYFNLPILSLKYATSIVSRNTIYRLKLKVIQYLYSVYLLDVVQTLLSKIKWGLSEVQTSPLYVFWECGR